MTNRMKSELITCYNHKWVLISTEFYDEPIPTTYYWYECSKCGARYDYSEQG